MESLGARTAPPPLFLSFVFLLLLCSVVGAAHKSEGVGAEEVCARAEDVGGEICFAGRRETL